MSTNEPMTQEQLDAIKGREAKATIGPWGVDGPSLCGGVDSLAVYHVEDGGAVAYVQPSWDDAVFIAEAREDVPALLAEVERLRGKIADAWDEGYKAGDNDNAGVWNFDRGATPNPYRKEDND